MISDTTSTLNKYQKLAAKMRCGVQLVPQQAQGQFFVYGDEEETTVAAACALGHLRVCIAHEIDAHPCDINVTDALEQLGFTPEEANSVNPERIQSIIVHWNDEDKLDTLEIAAKLDGMTDEALKRVYRNFYGE